MSDQGSPGGGSRPETEWIVGADEAGLPLDKFLAAPARLGSRSRAAEARSKGKVFVNGEEVGPAGATRRVARGEAVRLWMDRPGSAKRRPSPVRRKGLDILYEDAAIIVIDKPAGLLAVPLPVREAEPSVLDQIVAHLRSHGKRRPFIVHRIDRDTSGIVLFAKDARAQAALKRQFLARTPERVYHAVVYGHPSPDAGTWRDHLAFDEKALIQKRTSARDPRGAEAICDYRVLERFEGAALIEVRLTTGKRNQIRIQARLRGHTLVGERRYTYGPDDLRPLDFPRQALHARRLGIVHPVDGRPMTFEAPLPPDMTALIASLRADRGSGGERQGRTADRERRS